MMGLLSGISKFLTTNVVGKAITKSLDTLSGIVTNPVTAITQGTKASTAKFVAATPIQNAVKTITNVGLAAAAVVGFGAIAEGGLAAVGTAAKKLIPATTKGKVIAAIATPIAIGAVSQNPAKSAEIVLNAPSNLANFGQNAAKLAANPSIAGAKELITENPLIAGAAAVGVATAIGGGIGLAANTAATFINSQATKANTAASIGTDSSLPISVSDQSGRMFSIMPVQQGALASATPVTPQTKTISKSGAVRRRKRKSKSSAPTSINQKVNVMVSNRNSSIGIRQSKRYLNREILLN